MNARKTLVTLTMLVAIIGLAAFVIPFVLSLNPTEAAKNNLIGVDISNLSVGDYMEVDNDGYKVLIIKDWNNSIQAFAIPFNKDNGYMLPDIIWYRPFNPCNKFGPEIENGKLKRNGTIKCFDEKLSEWWRKEYIWSYSGENLGKHCSDLPIPKYVISNNTFKFTGRGWIVK